MESSRAVPSAPSVAALPRALCLLVLLLMTIAAVYGAFIALREFRHIGV